MKRRSLFSGMIAAFASYLGVGAAKAAINKRSYLSCRILEDGEMIAEEQTAVQCMIMLALTHGPRTHKRLKYAFDIDAEDLTRDLAILEERGQLTSRAVGSRGKIVEYVGTSYGIKEAMGMWGNCDWFEVTSAEPKVVRRITISTSKEGAVLA